MISIRQNILTSVVKLRPKHDLNQIPSGKEGSPSLLSNVAWHYHGHRDKITLHHMPMQPDIWLAPQSQHQPTSTASQQRKQETAKTPGNRRSRDISAWFKNHVPITPFYPIYETYAFAAPRTPHFREPQKTGRFFLCWSSINLCPPLSRHSSWQPVIDRLTKLGAKYRSFELCLASMSFNLTAVYEEHQQIPWLYFVGGWSWGGNRMYQQVCRQ